MIAIGLRFLTGRYHATPWGRHVNEAAVEWPPSPWRLLRGLVATWKRKLPNLNQDDVEPLLKMLAVPPRFHLPAAAVGHTRHYMPWFKKGPDDRTLVFDTFVAMARTDEVVALWPYIDFDLGRRETLQTLLEHVGFLGRAEAWCDAKLLASEDAGRIQPNCFPLDHEGAPEEHEIVRLLCADPQSAFSDEHVVRVETLSKGRGKDKVTQSLRRPLYDPNWNLCMETLQLHEEKWSDPPGSRWVSYARRSDSFRVLPERLSGRTYGKRERMQVARFALDSTVLPRVTETLPVAELARRALMSIYGGMNPQADGSAGRSSTFSGKNVHSEKRRDPHLHAFYLPTDEDEDGRLDHLTIVAEEGFGPEEVKSLDRLASLKGADRDAVSHPLRTLLLGLDHREAFDTGPSAQSRVWVSATPFVAPRHPKRRGQNGDDPRFWRRRSDADLERLRAEGKHLTEHVFADPVGWLQVVLREELARFLVRRTDLADIDAEHIQIHPLLQAGTFRLSTRKLRPIQFKRYRQKSGDDGGRRLAGAFRVVFPRQVRGPVCLGHSAHFGLGLFVPADGSRCKAGNEMTGRANCRMR